MMDSFKYPCFYYPTEIVLIDDNSTYLSTLKLVLEKNFKVKNFKFFTKPEDALEYLHNSPKANTKSRLFSNIDTFQPKIHALNVDLGKLYHEVYDPSRFRQVSLVLVDYEMGSMNGIEFCTQLSDYNIQKILVTGKKDDAMVIQSFNEGKIDRFVRKQDLNNIDGLCNLIRKSQIIYFETLSKRIYESIPSKNNFPLAFKDNTFLDGLKKLILKENIVEYYLLEAVGSLLLLDKFGKAKTLFVQNKDQQEANILEFDSEFNETLTPQTLDKLRKRDKLFCYYEIGEYNSNLLNTNEYVYDAIKMNGCEDFLCSLVEGFKPLDKDRIVSYSEHEKTIVYDDLS